MRKRYLPSQIIGFFTPDAVAGTWVPKHRFLLTCFCIALMGLLLSTNTLQAQSGQCLGGGCSGGSSWGAVQSTTSTTFVSAVSGTFAGEYNTFNVTSGMQYEWWWCHQPHQRHTINFAQYGWDEFMLLWWFVWPCIQNFMDGHVYRPGTGFN